MSSLNQAAKGAVYTSILQVSQAMKCSVFVASFVSCVYILRYPESILTCLYAFTPCVSTGSITFEHFCFKCCHLAIYFSGGVGCG